MQSTPHLQANEPLVILVDTQDQPIGTAPKMYAHEAALLHRAFSVFVFNSRNELMLQQRAMTKYHSGGLWTNTCCSHPAPGETTEQAAHRRLQEELGFDCALDYGFGFVYRTDFENGLSEHEYDHVFFGRFEGDFELNAEEVADIRWISLAELDHWMDRQPQDFTFWFKHIYERVKEHLAKAGGHA
jgi:isopentenyl-diphosphate delta-isomerase